jgi:hypothetical protein
MNAEQFKQVIRKLVIEEVRREVASQLPKLLFEMIGQQPKVVVREQKQLVKQSVKLPTVKQFVPNDGSDPDSEPIRQQSPQPKVIKRYAKDPKLNAILNETTPGLPTTPYGQGIPIGMPDFEKVGVSDEFMGEMREILSEGSDQPQEVVEEAPAGPDLSKLFNKNFKAILDKSKGKTGGGLGTSMIQNW